MTGPKRDAKDCLDQKQKQKFSELQGTFMYT